MYSPHYNQHTQHTQHTQGVHQEVTPQADTNETMNELPVPSGPDLKKCSPDTLAVAKFLRHNAIIKQRPALLGGQRIEMFRIKRAVRALLDASYEKARAANPRLPKIPDRKTALLCLAKLPAEGFAVNVVKLETEDALAKGLKPKSGVPVVLVSPQQNVGESEYFVWFYNPTPLMTYVYGAGMVVGGVSLALYQLWPMWARKASYYISMGSLVLVGLLLAVSALRLVLFVLSLPVLSKGFWLLPNLYADVGFFQSFSPLWGWSGDKTLAKLKPKKRKSKAASAGARNGAVPMGAQMGAVPMGGVPGVVPGALPGQAGPGQPMLMRQTPNGPVPVQLPPGVMPAGPDKPGQFVMHPLMQQLMGVAIERAKARFFEIVKTNGPPANETEGRQLQQRLVQEEAEKIQKEIAMAQQQVQQAQANLGQMGGQMGSK